MFVDWMTTRTIHEDRLRENMRHVDVNESEHKERKFKLPRVGKGFKFSLS